ncbi:hypothetical protein GQ457_08G035640 [Hibiscus cannabinus]
MDANMGVTIIEHVVGNGKGGHKAVSLVEHSFEGKIHSYRKGGKERGSNSKLGWEVNKKGIQTFKPQDNQLLSREAPLVWSQQLADQLDQIGMTTSSGDRLDLLHEANDTYVVDSSDNSDPEIGADYMEEATGATSPSFRLILRSLVHEHHVDVVALFETRVASSRVDRVISKFGFEHSFRVECHGFSGGIWLLWKDKIALQALHISNQFINVSFIEERRQVWVKFIMVYTSSKAVNRKHLWEKLKALTPVDSSPWFIGGDFNVILNSSERFGGIPSIYKGSRSFSKFIHLAGLLDLGFQGLPFTWSRSSLQQRIARCLVNSEWSSCFPSSSCVSSGANWFRP